MFSSLFIILMAIVAVIFGWWLVALCFRRVVPTNEVHIVQRQQETISYGKDMEGGNVYYEFPQWVPFFGIRKIILPVSNFALDLKDYEAYDKDRVPFEVDLTAFFRIDNPNTAAQRVSSFEQLMAQLHSIVQGAVRAVLANNEISGIMQGREEYGNLFTKEVGAQLLNWGVVAVRNIELMDIRDVPNGTVIKNIMAMKQSHIAMESRQAVAQNNKEADIAETLARQASAVQEQQSEEAIGKRTAEKEQQVGLAHELSKQAVATAQEITAQKTMAVLRVQEEQQADIRRQVAIVQAEQEKRSTILAAEAYLEKQQREAEATRALGNAKADAEKAILLAPVEAQVTLAREIGTNPGYQQYLVTIRQIESQQSVGMVQAESLKGADIKIISHAGTPLEGLDHVMKIFSGQGGVAIGNLVETLTQYPQIKKMLNKDEE